MTSPGPAVQIGYEVVMFYKITLEDGSVVESNFGADPIHFRVGDGTFDSGMEMALLGQTRGKHESLLIGPEIAFGYPDEKAIITMSKSEFPADMQVNEQSLVSFTTPTGDSAYGVILEDLGDSYKVDLNHPLAGHTFTFEYKILDVIYP